MLVLSRNPDQGIHVPQYGIKFRVLGVDGKRVRIGIDAPDDVRILRDELAFESCEELSGRTKSKDCRDPGFVWPLGVQFVPDRANLSPKNHIREQFPNRFKEAVGVNVPRFAPSLAH